MEVNLFPCNVCYCIYSTQKEQHACQRDHAGSSELVECNKCGNRYIKDNGCIQCANAPVAITTQVIQQQQQQPMAITSQQPQTTATITEMKAPLHMVLEEIEEEPQIESMNKNSYTTQVESKSSDIKEKFMWPTDITTKLIQMFKDNYEDFSGKKIKKHHFYAKFANELSAEVPNITAIHVEKKWGNVIKKLRKYEEAQRTPGPSKVQRPHDYELLKSFLDGTPKVNFLPRAGNITWTKKSTTRLIELFRENYDDYNGQKIKKNVFYEIFATLLSQELPNITAGNVELKWSSILTHFQRYETCRQNGDYSCERPRDYDLLASFLIEDPYRPQPRECITWTPENRRKLIKLFKDNYDAICKKEIKKQRFYAKFAAELRPNMPTVTSYHVEKKWGNILKQLRNYEESKLRSGGPRVKYPDDYDLLSSFLIPEVTNESPKKESMVWTPEATRRLVELFKENYSDYSTRKKTKHHFYVKFARELSNVVPGITTVQVQKKWGNIFKHLKRYKLSLKYGTFKVKQPLEYDLLRSFLPSRLFHDYPDEESAMIAALQDPDSNQEFDNDAQNVYYNLESENNIKQETKFSEQQSKSKLNNFLDGHSTSSNKLPLLTDFDLNSNDSEEESILNFFSQQKEIDKDPSMDNNAKFEKLNKNIEEFNKNFHEFIRLKREQNINLYKLINRITQYHNDIKERSFN